MGYFNAIEKNERWNTTLEISGEVTRHSVNRKI